MSRLTKLRALAVLSAAAALASCSGTTAHQTAQPLHQAGEAAYSEASGIRMLLRSDAWSGPDVRQHVLPLRISISNDSGVPLRVRYGAFALIAPDGTRHGAVAPFRVELDADQPRAVSTVGPFTPGFSSTRFLVAPFLGSLYPSLAVIGEPFELDREVYAIAERFWRDTALPTAQMVALALPEGVLAGGGRLAGYMYFEHVAPQTQRVLFEAGLVNAVTGEDLGTVSIPFALNR